MAKGIMRTERHSPKKIKRVEEQHKLDSGNMHWKVTHELQA